MTYRQLLDAHRDFRRLWTGQVVSEIGDWLNNIAVLALALELAGPTHQGRAVAIYAVARHLPLFVFGPVAGIVVDRRDRRRVMVGADAARALLALGFLFAHWLHSPPLIYIVAAALFSVSAFFNAAKRATIPNLVSDPDALLAANSLSASTTAATIAIGSALGGLVATFFGRDLVFVVNAATFLVSAEMIRRISWRRQTSPRLAMSGQRSVNALRAVLNEERRGLEMEASPARAVAVAMYTDAPANNDRTQPPPNSMLRRAWTDFRDGLSYVRQERVLAALFVVAAGWGLGNGAARALYSVFGARLGEGAAAGLVAHPKDFGISVLFVAMGVGGVLGAPLARRFNAAGNDLGARMGRSLFLDGCGLALFSLMPNLWGACLVLIAREMNFAIWWTAQQTLIMRRTDDRFAGRVFASYETLTTLMMVSSIYAAGAAADAYGIRWVAAAGGAVIASSGALWFLLRRRESNTPRHAAIVG